MTAIPSFAMQDCYEITKKFERAAHFSASEESVFAMFTPLLNNIRISTKSFLTQVDANTSLLQSSAALRGNTLAEDDDEGYNPQLAGKSIAQEDLGKTIADKIKECFPCEFRLDLAGDAFTKLWDGMFEYLELIARHYEKMLQQLLGMLDFFDLDRGIADICAVQKFFTDFVCIPDLRRMMAALMALLAKMAMELSSVFDMILQLVGPILVPFLSSVINTLEEFMMMIVKPLQCIIDSMIKFIDKTDYSVLFQSGDNFNLSIGPQGQKGGRGSIKVKGSKVAARKFETPDLRPVDGPAPNTIAQSPRGADTEIFSYDRPDLNWGTTVDINPFHAVNRSEQRAIEEAEDELKKLRQDRRNVDMSDPEARKAYSKRLEDARQKKKEAVRESQVTEAQKARQQLLRFKGYVKSIFTKILGYIREAIAVIEGLLADIVGEFQKFMTSLTGGGDAAQRKMFKKLEILKILELIAAMIELAGNKSCDDLEEEGILFEQIVPTQQGLTVWTDNEGFTHIEENPEDLASAIDKVLLAKGVSPTDPTTLDPQSNVVKDTPSENLTRQKLRSLIEFTGDPVLDTTIARVVEGVTTPAKVSFKCPLQTSVAGAEQVNQWIKELNSE